MAVVTEYIILNDELPQADCGYVRSLLESGSVVGEILRVGLRRQDVSCYLLLPRGWDLENIDDDSRVGYYSADGGFDFGKAGSANSEGWICLSDGRYVVDMDYEKLAGVLDRLDVDVVCVNVAPELAAYHEKIRLDSQGDVAGFRRLYTDESRRCAVPNKQPHRTYIKSTAWRQLAEDRIIPVEYTLLQRRCGESGLSMAGVEMAGAILDLESEKDLLRFYQCYLKKHISSQTVVTGEGVQIADSARLFGAVILGSNVVVEKNVILSGPVMVGDNCHIGAGAVVCSAVLGTDVDVPAGGQISRRVILKHDDIDRISQSHFFHGNADLNIRFGHEEAHRYRCWARFSYGGIFKRFADIVFASVFLLLMLPLLPIVAILIKLDSRGPVFFRHKRQGRHACDFGCVKLRTMMVGADDIQARLRKKNEVDGPQFKIDNDPRISRLGDFLRETCIDEIPQFYNVLVGQMSVVGPRPSPEQENSLCAQWRDGRLSVRPGITGLWQVCRTREAGQDFQEWITHDLKYVRNLSWQLDLWICWRTFVQLVTKFLQQF